MLCQSCKRTRRPEDFDGSSKTCRMCEQCRYRCDICQVHSKEAFSDAQIHNWSQNLVHRCEECMVCQSCKRTETTQAFDGSSKICGRCAAPIQCGRCNEKKETKEFPADDVVNHINGSTKQMMCTACSDQGFTPRDSKAYACSRCKQLFGRRRFDAWKVNDFQQGRAKKLVCNQCR